MDSVIQKQITDLRQALLEKKQAAIEKSSLFFDNIKTPELIEG